MSDALDLDGPLASVGLRAMRCPGGASPDGAQETAAAPLALRVLESAPDRELPAYRYDPVRQIAVTPDGQPLTPNLAKDWTTIPGTETDGDGGDNESWAWEEL